MNFNKTIRGLSLSKMDLTLKVFLYLKEEEVIMAKDGLISPSDFNTVVLHNAIVKNLNESLAPERGKMKILISLDRGLVPTDRMLLDLHILSGMLSKRNIRVFINLSDEECSQLETLLLQVEHFKQIKNETFKGDSKAFIKMIDSIKPMLNSRAKNVLKRLSLPKEDAEQTKLSSPVLKEGLTVLPKVEVLPLQELKSNSIDESSDNFRGRDVLIVDCYNLFHRMFHGVGNIVDANFQPIGLIRGLKNIINYINSTKPDFVIFANEGTEKIDVRKEIFPQYKAGRSETEKPLAIQIPQCISILGKLGFSVVEKEGYEADDVIASYSTEFKEKGANVKIYSTDKDLYQLISYDNDEPGSINVYDWAKKEIITEEHCIKKFGVSFDKCLLVQAIMGDISDGVPGAAGVGVKTASELIESYGTIEGIYENIEDLKGAKKRKIEEQRAEIEMSLRLVTLSTDLAKDEPLLIYKTPFYQDKDFKFDNNTEKVLKTA